MLTRKFPGSSVSCVVRRRRTCSRELSLPLSFNASASITIKTGAITTVEAIRIGSIINSRHCLVMSAVCLSSLLSQTALANARRMAGLQSVKSRATVVKYFLVVVICYPCAIKLYGRWLICLSLLCQTTIGRAARLPQSC